MRDFVAADTVSRLPNSSAGLRCAVGGFDDDASAKGFDDARRSLRCVVDAHVSVRELLQTGDANQRGRMRVVERRVQRSGVSVVALSR